MSQCVLKDCFDIGCETEKTELEPSVPPVSPSVLQGIWSEWVFFGCADVKPSRCPRTLCLHEGFSLFIEAFLL